MQAPPPPPPPPPPPRMQSRIAIATGGTLHARAGVGIVGTLTLLLTGEIGRGLIQSCVSVRDEQYNCAGS